jgi:hypothetical protein
VTGCLAGVAASQGAEQALLAFGGALCWSTHMTHSLVSINGDPCLAHFALDIVISVAVVR